MMAINTAVLVPSVNDSADSLEIIGGLFTGGV